MEVYYLPGCPYSEDARKLLKDQQVPFKEVAITKIAHLHEVSKTKDPKLAALIAKTKHSKMPLIIYRHNGTPHYIGGYQQLLQLTNNLKRLNRKKTIQDERIASLAQLFGH